jgi:hypothetical protein
LCKKYLNIIRGCTNEEEKVFGRGICNSFDDSSLSVELAFRIVDDESAIAVVLHPGAMMTKQIFGQQKSVTIVGLDKRLIGFEMAGFSKQPISG